MKGWAKLPAQKTSPEDVANAILDGVVSARKTSSRTGFPRGVYEAWRIDHKAVERQFAA